MLHLAHIFGVTFHTINREYNDLNLSFFSSLRGIYHFRQQASNTCLIVSNCCGVSTMQIIFLLMCYGNTHNFQVFGFQGNIEYVCVRISKQLTIHQQGNGEVNL